MFQSWSYQLIETFVEKKKIVSKNNSKNKSETSKWMIWKDLNERPMTEKKWYQTIS